MKQYTAKSIRNIALVGHADAGKTTLAEAAYYLTGQSDRLGRVPDGNTICDFDAEEIARQGSVSTALLPLEWKNTKMNLLDTPGLFDFSGGVSEGIRAAGSALIVVSGKSGLEVGAEKGFAAASKKGIAKLFFVNHMDNEHADFFKVYEELKAKYGMGLCPLVIPYVEDRKVKCYVNLIENKAYTYDKGKATEVPVPDMGPQIRELRTTIEEAVAEGSEELMEKYFDGVEFTHGELIEGLAHGVRRGEIAPVFCGSAFELEAIDQLLNGLIWLAPWAESVAGEDGLDADGNSVALTVDETAQTVATVFKTVVDPFVGKLLYFKVVSGKVTADSTLYNPRTGSTE
ncbi:MAG: elongation factor G, partial [Clostridia bacterium]|nr:elongation factor G [Clostridia bacterium]